MRTLAAPIILSLLFVVSSYSQTTVSPEKRELIHQFGELTKSNEIDFNITYSADGFKKKLVDMVDNDAVLTNAQKDQLHTEAAEVVLRVGNKWKDIFESDPEFRTFGIESAYEVYGKTFTEDELKELIAFYSSPLGKKTVAFFGTVKEDVERTYIERSRPKMESIIGPLVDAETTAFAKRITDMKKTGK